MLTNSLFQAVPSLDHMINVCALTSTYSVNVFV